MSTPDEFGAVYHNATCQCGRNWTKTLSGLITCPHCTKPRTSMGTDGWWVVLWVLMLAVHVVGAVVLVLTKPEPPSPIQVEADHGR